MADTIYLRDILQRSPNGISLIVEAKITQEEFDAMRTTTLITPETVFELPSIVYWYDGGDPPKPIFMDCPEDWRGRAVDRGELIPQVNRRIISRWFLKYKPPLKLTGEAE